MRWLERRQALSTVDVTYFDLHTRYHGRHWYTLARLASKSGYHVITFSLEDLDRSTAYNRDAALSPFTLWCCSYSALTSPQQMTTAAVTGTRTRRRHPIQAPAFWLLVHFTVYDYADIQTNTLCSPSLDNSRAHASIYSSTTDANLSVIFCRSSSYCNPVSQLRTTFSRRTYLFGHGLFAVLRQLKLHVSELCLYL